MNIPGVLAGSLALVVLSHGVPFTLLAVVALKRPGAARPASRRWDLVTVVPAHNEEGGLDACLESLQAAGQGRELIVVADNCGDGTAEVARGQGVTVLERFDSKNRGKSYALAFALDHLRVRPVPPDGVVFVDADTVVSSHFYEAIESRLDAGAQALQVHYLAGDGDTGLARLRRLAFRLVHWSRPLGAERLGLGTGLKGNGMALRWDVASRREAGHGITEDAALTLALARAGVRVCFEPRAWVRGFMAARYDAARVQDQRWERGRFGLMRESFSSALAALRRGNLPCAWAALEVASLPLSALVMVAAVSLALGAVIGELMLPVAAAGSLFAYVVVGLVAARAPMRDVAAMALAPRFLAHKASVYAGLVLRRGTGAWVRTSRED